MPHMLAHVRHMLFSASEMFADDTLSSVKDFRAGSLKQATFAT